MNSEWMARNARAGTLFLAAVAIFAIGGIIVSCSGGSSKTMVSGTGTVNVTLSDPPSCMPPNGQFTHVYVTVRSVQAHTSATATDSSAGWQELAPQLASAPMQIDLFSKPQTTCILAQLGSASLPAGSYQQIRLLLVSNTPQAGAAVPSTNACAGNGFNCVVLQDTTIHELDLSSEANTGLKIPPGQIVGGPLQVTAGQSVDLNIDFNACASIVQEGNGKFRLKPTLTAGQVSANNTGISGKVVDSVTSAPIAGSVQVAIEQPDSTGVDRIVMQSVADSSGNFNFCPLPTGTFDIVVVAIGPANVPYNPTAVLNVPNGTNLAAIPLIAEVGATAPAVFQGVVTATNGTAAGSIDVSLSALQTVPTGATTTLQITIPLQTIPATNTTPEVDSTGLISVSTNTNCPTGAPANSNCAQYTLVVPASNPSVGLFSSSGFTYSTPPAGDVLFTVDAKAAVPLSGGTPDCTPSEMMVAKDSTAAPLKAVAATTTTVAEIDFSSCM
ncbi:MAG TPA: DUF4382 domain-containing protein [Candidatus Sulfotelmatobacter sp.]|jgi:hypothetical protein|nr:DUF4382 domain-containing protein [Candidatus Sulfotelmatobacter sp.]